MFKKIILLIALPLYLALPFAVYANDSQIKEPFIKPNGDLYYQMLRGYEKLLEKFQFSDESKFKFHQDLLITRFSELKYVAERKDVGELQKSTERFSYEAGMLAQLSEKLNNINKANIQNQFKEYRPTLEKLRDLYVHQSSFWRLIQYDIDTLDILSKKLNS